MSDGHEAPRRRSPGARDRDRLRQAYAKGPVRAVRSTNDPIVEIPAPTATILQIVLGVPWWLWLLVGFLGGYLLALISR